MSEENKERLTEGEVNDVLNVFNFLEFSRSYKDTYYQGLFTPELINQQMQQNTMSPLDISVDDLKRALQNPMSSESILRDYSTYLELTNMYYKRLLDYMSGLPAFNMTFDCINIEKESEYRSKEYKADLKEVEKFCTKFDYKDEFRKALRQSYRQGAFFGVLRDEEDSKYTLQELPIKYCKITGRHAYGDLFDFDMQYFAGISGVDINMYPKVFKKMYRRVFRRTTTKYDPAKNPDHRNSSFIYWHQCSPYDNFWVFKPSAELTTLLPYFSPLFDDISFTPVARKLQEDKFFIEASKMIVGILGFNKDTKTGQTPNQVNITPDVLGKFLGVARSGLNKQIGLTALPVENIETVEFDTSNSNVVSEQTKSVANQSVSSAAVLLNDTKLNVQQSKLAVAIDSNIVKAMYPMFSNFMEFFVNKNTKKYKFKFRFSDFDIPDDKADRQTKLSNMTKIGIVDFQYVARANDMDVFELKRSLQSSKNMGFDNLITDLLIPTSHFANNGSTSSSSNVSTGNPVGRPSNPNSDNENTVASLERDSNSLKE